MCGFPISSSTLLVILVVLSLMLVLIMYISISKNTLKNLVKVSSCLTCHSSLTSTWKDAVFLLFVFCLFFVLFRSIFSCLLPVVSKANPFLEASFQESHCSDFLWVLSSQMAVIWFL